jgi:hypothetical protein
MRDWSAGSHGVSPQQAEIQTEKTNKNEEQFCVSLYVAPAKSKRHLRAQARIEPSLKLEDS